MFLNIIEKCDIFNKSSNDKTNSINKTKLLIRRKLSYIMDVKIFNYFQILSFFRGFLIILENINNKFTFKK